MFFLFSVSSVHETINNSFLPKLDFFFLTDFFWSWLRFFTFFFLFCFFFVLWHTWLFAEARKKDIMSFKNISKISYRKVSSFFHRKMKIGCTFRVSTFFLSTAVCSIFKRNIRQVPNTKTLFDISSSFFFLKGFLDLSPSLMTWIGTWNLLISLYLRSRVSISSTAGGS